MTGKISGKPVSYSTRFDFPEKADRNPEVERLWAYQTIETELYKMSLLGADADTKQSVFFTPQEIHFISPYTSMITMREERFAELGIARTNKQRVTIEHKAQAKRATQPVKTTRVDKPKPMFSSPQPNYSSRSRGGSGNLGLLGIMFAAFATVLGLRSHTTSRQS